MIANCLPNSENASSNNRAESNDVGLDDEGSSLQHGNPVSHKDIKWIPCDVRRGL